MFDVDFIAKETNSIFFIEVKNSNFRGVDNPKDFKTLHSDLRRVWASKYFDSFHYVQELGKTSLKQKIYICLIEIPLGDSIMRGLLNCKKISWKRLIDDVLVFSFDEWRNKFSQFQISRLKPQLKQN